MAVIKVACPKCGQRVSGDESFYGVTVDCPVCTSAIRFPGGDGKLASTGETSGPSRQVPLGVPRGGAANNPTARVPHSAVTTPPPGKALSENAVEPVSPKGGGEAASASGKGTPADSKGRSAASPEPSPYHKVSPEELPSPVLGVVSMVLGILNAVMLCLPGILLAPAAIIAGHIALAKARHSPVKPAPGQNMAVAGLILGYTGLAVFIVILLSVRIWIRYLQ